MKSKKRKKVRAIVCVAIAIIAVGIGGFLAFTDYRMNQVPKMSFDSMLNYTTKNNENAVVTVGVIQNGEASFTVYGKNAVKLPQSEHVYEIGSLTKTFTTSLLFKAGSEGEISLDDQIDEYLDLPKRDYYPTIRRLITHTSGYKAYYFEPQMVSNFFHARNDFYGISTEQLIQKVGETKLEDRDYAFKYSNFGMAVIGAVLSEIYSNDYTTVIKSYISNDLDLSSTKISDGSGDLGNYWDWAENDAYIPAGALTSDITDMLKYAQLQMNDTPEYLSAAHEALANVNATPAKSAKMNIHVDSVGAGWMIDAENKVVWHNGGTSSYNCYLGFDSERKIAVIILSNLSPNYRIPATVMGIKLLTDLQANVDKAR